VNAPLTVQRLIDAATALLEARSNQMVTAEEWRALRDAVIACGGTVESEVEIDG
jgi:hypothetical protein